MSANIVAWVEVSRAIPSFISGADSLRWLVSVRALAKSFFFFELKRNCFAVKLV